MEMPESSTGAAEETGWPSGGAQKGSDTDRDGEEEDQTSPLPPLPPRSSAAGQSRRSEPTEDDEQEVGSSVPAEEYPPYPPPPYPSAGNHDGQEEEEDNGMRAPEVTGQVTLPPVRCFILTVATESYILGHIKEKITLNGENQLQHFG